MTMHAVKDQHEQAVSDLQRLLGDTYVDEHGDEHHGLAWWYPQMNAWLTVRSVGGGGGGKPGTSLPFNASALDFVAGWYWIGLDDQDRCSHADLMTETNYERGFERTVLHLEAQVRLALRLGAPPVRPRGGALEPKPAVVQALEWLYAVSDTIQVEAPIVAAIVSNHARRVLARSVGMAWGAKWAAGRGPCPKCHNVDTVVSDEDRAVCVQTSCRRPDGSRWCWRFTEGMWVEVAEPDVRGRGQVSDDDLSRWAETG